MTPEEQQAFQAYADVVRAKITGPQRGVATFADHMALGVMSQLAGGDPDVDPGDVRRLRDLVSRIAEGRYADYARRCASGSTAIVVTCASSAASMMPAYPSTSRPSVATT